MLRLQLNPEIIKVKYRKKEYMKGKYLGQITKALIPAV